MLEMEGGTHRPYTVPHVAIDLIAEKMRKEMGHFMLELSEPNDAIRSVQSDLASLCLVQRSWLLPAQQALQYRIVVRSADALNLLSQLPNIGHATRELFFSGRWAKSEMRQLLVLLDRMHDLRFLAICLEFYDERIHYDTLTEAIHIAGSKMPALEGLFFPVAKQVPEDVWYMSHESERGKSYLGTLCEEVSRMENLSMLWISRYGCSMESVSEALSEELEACIPPRLQSLVLQVPSDPTPRNHLRWLLQPRKVEALRSLIICVDNYNNQASNLSDLAYIFGDLALPSVENLHVEILFKKFSMFYKVTVFLSALLQSCTALRTLRLGIDIFKAVAALPVSLEKVHLEVRDLAYQGISSWPDAYIYAMLMNQPFPRLRIVEICGYSAQSADGADAEPEGGHDLEKGIMPRVATFCKNSDRPVWFKATMNGNLDLGKVLLHFVDPDRVGYNSFSTPMLPSSDDG